MRVIIVTVATAAIFICAYILKKKMQCEKNKKALKAEEVLLVSPNYA